MGYAIKHHNSHVENYMLQSFINRQRKFKVHMLQSSVIMQEIQSLHVAKFCYYAENLKYTCYKVMPLCKKFKVYMLQSFAIIQEIQSSHVTKLCYYAENMYEIQSSNVTEFCYYVGNSKFICHK